MAIYQVLRTLTFAALCHAANSCHQGDSKIVRKYVQEEILPIYEDLGLPIPKTCLMHLENDIYDIYERHKFVEGPSKWVCQLCGKAFYEERFLNQHFRNRHSTFVSQGTGSVCMADYCDIFRCEVITQKHKPQYWDKALCKSNVLKDRKNKCEELIVKPCVPDITDTKLKDQLYKSLQSKVCDFLSCNLYWDLPQPKVPALTVAGYIVAWMFLVLVLFIYYFITCSHFFTDDSILDPDHRLRVPIEEKLRFFLWEGKKANTTGKKNKYKKTK